MANNSNPNYEVPTEMRDFAEKSVDQARKAIDGFMGAAQKTLDTFEGAGSTVQSSAKDVSRKTLSYAEQNIAAAFDLAQKLVRSRDLQEAMQHQGEFVRQQFAAMQAQMKEFGSLTQSAMQQASSQAQQATAQAQQAAGQAHPGQGFQSGQGTPGQQPPRRD